MKYTLASDVPCPKCGAAEGWAWIEPKGPHLKMTCPAGHYIKFLPKPGSEAKKDPGSWEWAHPARARMRDLPPSPAQLELIGRSEWRWLAPHLRDRDMASKLVSWIVAEAE